MKKTMFALGLAACAVSFFAACKKDTTTPTPTTGGIVARGNTLTEIYGVDSVTADFFGEHGNILGVTACNADTSTAIRAFFIFNGDARPASGNYIVGDNSAGHMTVCYFYYSTAGNGLYTADVNPATPVTATVTNTNGKVSIVLPALSTPGLYTPSTTGASVTNDTTTISGTFKEL